MKSMFFIVPFTLFFFNSAHAICVPRNRSATTPYPNSSPVLKPVSSSPAPKLPTPSSPPQSLPSSLPNDSTPSSPAPKAPSPTANPSFIKNPIDAIKSALPKPGGGGDNPGLKKICDSTDYPDVCLSTLGPLAGPASDAASVLGVAIKAGSDSAKTAIETAHNLATKPGTPPDEAFKDCKDSYDDVAYNFQNAADALPLKDIGTMNTMLSAALTNVEDCKDALEGRDTPLTPISETLRKMASNCLAIVDVMNKPPA
ncbi:uncharacterized protein LOC141678640 [Apium graveolens]|uniref:uncharacterized protein LOC141678640 n=1 Tax=Apium graveolens TaxID=4045 RepID=UPI003D79D111